MAFLLSVFKAQTKVGEEQTEGPVYPSFLFVEIKIPYKTWHSKLAAAVWYPGTKKSCREYIYIAQYL